MSSAGRAGAEWSRAVLCSSAPLGPSLPGPIVLHRISATTMDMEEFILFLAQAQRSSNFSHV